MRGLMIRQPLICSAWGVPRAPSTQTQLRHDCSHKKTASGGIKKRSKTRKYSRLPCRQDRLPKLAEGRSAKNLLVQTPVFIRSHLIAGLYCIKDRTHTAVWSAIDLHADAHLLLLCFLFMSRFLSLLASTTLREQSAGVERGWQRRWKTVMKAQW